MLDTPTNLASLLKDPSLLVTKAYIGGEWVDGEGGATFDVINPARGDVIAQVADIKCCGMQSCLIRCFNQGTTVADRKHFESEVVDHITGCPVASAGGNHNLNAIFMYFLQR